MGKGYAEGPAAEAAEEERQRRAAAKPTAHPSRRAVTRSAVFGSTPDHREVHRLGWADDLDVDALFASGAAWGLSVRTVTEA
jgi:hypothetical protein